MKLSKKTVDLLDYASTIYPSILIRKGSVLRSRNLAKTALIKVVIDEEFPDDFVIYDIKNLLKVVDLFNEPDVTFNGVIDSGHMEISEGTATVRYKYSHPDLHTNIPADTDFTPTNTRWGMRVLLDENEIKNIMNAAKVMSLDTISFTQSGIKLSNSKEKDFTNFEILYQNSVDIDADAPDEFSFNFATANLNLYKGSYDAKFFAGTQTGVEFMKLEKDVTVWLGALPTSVV